MTKARNVIHFFTNVSTMYVSVLGFFRFFSWLSVFIFLPTGKYVKHFISGDQISHYLIISLIMFHFRPPKKSPVSGHLSTLKSVQWRTTGKYEIHVHCIRRDQISHIQSMAAKRGLTNQENVYTPRWKSRLKHSAAEFQLMQQFWLQLVIVS